MRTEEKIINIIFDPGKGTVSVSGREGVCGEPFGELPTPVRRGYRFDGWYLEGEKITPETIVTSEEDIRPIARWTREKNAPKSAKKSSLKKQKAAVAVLAAAVVVLAIALAVVLELITIYSLTDVYIKDGVEYSDSYTIKRQDGVYMLFDKEGKLMDTNGEDKDVFIAKGSGNQYRIDPETGDYSLVAIVDTADYEVVPGTRLMMYPQISSEDVYSIKVTHADGTGYTFIYDGKQVSIEGLGKTASAQYNKDLYAKLVSTCGYTLTVMKLDSKSEDSTVPRVPETGEIDYSVYGLDTPSAKFTITAAKDPEASTFEPDPERSYTVFLGDKTLTASGYYAKLENTKAIYVLTSERIDETVMQPIEKLVTPRVSLPVELNSHSMANDFYLSYLENWTGEDGIDGDPIVAFDYTELDYRINTMMQNYPYICDSNLLEGMDGYTINDSNASKVLTLFYEMTPNTCVKLGITNEALEKYNLLENVHYLTYKTKTGEYDENGKELYGINRMLISEKNEDGVHYVASFLYDMIVEVDQYYLSFLEWDEIDWYNKYFMSMNIVYAKEINFRFGNQVFDFTLDNDLSYAYYLVRSSEQSKIEMKFVNLKEGIVYKNEKGVLCYKKHSSETIYSPVKIMDLDSIELVSYETAVKNPTLENIIYVEDMYYYRNASNQNVQVVPDFVNDKIELREDGNYYYVYKGSSGETKEIKVNKSTGNLVYRESLRKLQKADGEVEYYHVTTNFETSASNVMIKSPQFNGGEGEDKHVLDYTIVDSKLNDSGITETENVSATDNFRRLHMQLLMIALEGDVDGEEFERNMGMSVKEFLNSGNAVPHAEITMRAEDYAKLLNASKVPDENGKLIPIHTKNMEQCLVFRFYRYTEWKSLVTIEALVKDENGNWVSSGDELAGRFYVNSSLLDKMQSDIGKILNQELIDYSTKY